MLDAMAPWSDHTPAYKGNRLHSPDRAQYREAGPSCAFQPNTPAPKAPARADLECVQRTLPATEKLSPAGAATHQTQAQASVSPPSEQPSDSTDADSTLAEERLQQAEPLLQEDEQRFTMYPIE